MEESRSYALHAQLDIEQILLEAQHRWLRPAEICGILQNHRKFRIAPEPPSRPPSGSLFLFDRNVLRYFRKDGHNWRKKKDGKTVKEAHERLKAGRVDVLHCYYAHGEDNENFQRRSYWMLEEELSHIVLVHYREVQGSRTYNRIRDADGTPNHSRRNGDPSKSDMYSSVTSSFQQHVHQGASQVTDTTSLTSTPASEYEDAESVYRHQAIPGFQSFQEIQPPTVQQTDVGSSSYCPVAISNNYQGKLSAIPGMNFKSISQGESSNISLDIGLTYELHRGLEFPAWGDVVESSNAGYQSMNFPPSVPSAQSSGLDEWQGSGSDSLHVSKWSSVDQKLEQNTYYSSLTQYLPNDLTTKPNGANQVELCDSSGLLNTYLTELSGQHIQNDLRLETLNTVDRSLKPEPNGNLNIEDKSNYPSLRQPLLNGVIGEGLKKLDSFDRWMSKELGDVAESTLQPGSGAYWETVGSEDDSGISNQVALDNYVLSPSLSQDQLFSIIDFSPYSAFSGSEIKVLISGRFLMNQEELENHRWACMFGEIEVPAQIVGDGVLRCYTPTHETGRVPFYITCSNRLACSEVREFEFQESSVQDADLGSFTSDETLLHMRFGKLLSLTNQAPIQSNSAETTQLCFKISALLEDDTEWEQMLNLTKQDEFFSADKVKDQLLKKLLKEKLHAWLIQKVSEGEGEKGPCVLDEGGQGVLHFAAALGYDWSIPPTIAAGVGVNFRDANGWTALHWAAYYGRERTVGFLISLGAAPGLVTDPTPVYPSGRTPSDLAAGNGHKGIAGYLAESSLSSLSSHLSSLNLKDSNSHRDSREKAVETVSERVATPAGGGVDATLKDSLEAVRNATQAAARIHQVFRYQSFQRKQLEEYGGSEFGISDERALSLIAGKSKKGGRHDEPVHAAATRIQNKFRSWKGRKDFLLIRKRIIKIQAHVRGHQVRKNYKKIIWSVWFIDRAILKWKRKGRGLSGLKLETHDAGTSMVDKETKEDEYDFLKDGRKQTEERLQKALARVKSMVKYPEAQDQYHRLLNVVSEMQETKATYDKVVNSLAGDFDFDDDMIDFESLWDDDDTFMPTAS